MVVGVQGGTAVQGRGHLVGMSTLEQRLAVLILAGEPFTADDVTNSGLVTLDPQHSPNAAQNGIGSMFRRASSQGLIEWTGRVVRSRAKHRKGGAIRVWQGTTKGRVWAGGQQTMHPVL